MNYSPPMRLIPPGSSAHTLLSYLANLTIAKQADGKAVVTELAITPSVFMEQRGGETKGLLLPLYKLNRLDVDSDTRAYIVKSNTYAKSIFGEEYLDDGLEKVAGVKTI